LTAWVKIKALVEDHPRWDIVTLRALLKQEPEYQNNSWGFEASWSLDSMEITIDVFYT